MKKIIWVILIIIIMIIPTIAYAETSMGKVKYMVEEHINTTLQNDEENEEQRDRVIKAVMELDDNVMREKMMGEVNELKKTIGDKLEINNNAKEMLGNYMFDSYMDKEENEAKRLEVIEAIDKINNEDKRNEMISSLNEFSIMLSSLHTTEGYLIKYLWSLRYLIIGLAVVAVSSLFLKYG